MIRRVLIRLRACVATNRLAHSLRRKSWTLKMKENFLVQIRRAASLFLRAFTKPSLIVGLLGCIALTATSKLHSLRIGIIKTDRIGHFVMDSSLRFLEQGTDSKPPALFWLSPKKETANAFWAELVQRNLRTTESWVVGQIAQAAAILPRVPSWFLPPPWATSASRDIRGLISRNPQTMEFTPLENQAGREWLEKVGCKPGQPFVCLLVRDSAYLNEHPTHNPSLNQRPKDFWNYHDYRDSPISSYLEPAEWLGDNGFFVFRMGRTMEKQFVSDHPRIVDYAFQPDRNDFLDVWLFANCSICITTGTGPDIISQVYKKPTVAVNYIPLSSSWTSTPVITAGKALYDRKGKRMTLEEHLTLNLSRSEDYKKRGVIIRDLSGPEILSVVKEAVRRIDGTWDNPTEDLYFQAKFMEILSTEPRRNLHGYFHPQARLSSEWIRQLEIGRSLG